MVNTENFPGLLCFQTNQACMTEERAYDAYDTDNACHLPKFFRVWTDQEQIEFWKNLEDPGFVMRYNPGEADPVTDRWSTTCGEPITIQVQWQLLQRAEVRQPDDFLSIRYELSVAWTVNFDASKEILESGSSGRVGNTSKP